MFCLTFFCVFDSVSCLPFLCSVFCLALVSCCLHSTLPACALEFYSFIVWSSHSRFLVSCICLLCFVHLCVHQTSVTTTDHNVYMHLPKGERFLGLSVEVLCFFVAMQTIELPAWQCALRGWKYFGAAVSPCILLRIFGSLAFYYFPPVQKCWWCQPIRTEGTFPRWGFPCQSTRYSM